ncbi:MAG: CYTH domain-containing protein [Myxococcota bacterium]|nr:CYTH domain-containing protein [Myxococcota bacterium]
MEIERKFRVQGRPWLEWAGGVAIRQAYLSRSAQAVVRVRLAADSAWLTVKGATKGISRPEFEYAIPRAEGHALLALCGDAVIEKTRYRREEGGSLFEVDVFEGDNAGLVVAEIELESPEQSFFRPAWLAEEVSHDPRYRNSELSVHPYSEWSRDSLSGGVDESSSSP